MIMIMVMDMIIPTAIIPTAIIHTAIIPTAIIHTFIIHTAITPAKYQLPIHNRENITLERIRTPELRFPLILLCSILKQGISLPLRP